MMMRKVALAILVLSLAACGDSAESPEASPILYEVRSSSGETEGWLFGTIHALPDGTRWRTPELQESIDEADLLVVEIADLADAEKLTSIYAQLSRSPQLPDIGNRVPVEDRPLLFSMIDKAGFAPRDFATLETWAVALTLAQVNATGDPRNGVDRAILKDFAGRPVLEFEGAEMQLGIFDQLPEAEQRDLLIGVLEESQSDNPSRLRDAWLSGDEDVLIDATNTGIMADRELREAILTGRNDAWMAQLLPMLEAPEQPLVAVGAAHLVGPEGLPAQLRQRGYVVERLQ